MVTVTLAKAICSHLTDNVAANSPVHMPRAHGEEYQRDRTDQGYFTRGISLAELSGFSKEMGPDIYRQTQILGRLISNSALRLRIIAMALCLCLSVCLSVTSRSSIKTAGFRHGSFLPPILLCVRKEIRVSSKKVYFPLRFCPNSGLAHIDRRKVLSTELDKG